MSVQSTGGIVIDGTWDDGDGSVRTSDELNIQYEVEVEGSGVATTWKWRKCSPPGTCPGTYSAVNLATAAHACATTPCAETYTVDGLNITVSRSNGLIVAADKWFYGITRDKFQWCERLGNDTCSPTYSNPSASIKYGSDAIRSGNTDNQKSTARLHTGETYAIDSDVGVYLIDNVQVTFRWALGHNVYDAWTTAVHPWKNGEEWKATIEPMSERFFNTSISNGLEVYLDLGPNRKIRPAQIDLDYACWDHSSIMQHLNLSTSTGCKLGYKAFGSLTGDFEAVPLWDEIYGDRTDSATWNTKSLFFSSSHIVAAGDLLMQAGTTGLVSNRSTSNEVVAHVIGMGFFETTKMVHYCTRAHVQINGGVYSCSYPTTQLSIPFKVVTATKDLPVTELPLVCSCTSLKQGENCEQIAEHTDTHGVVYKKSNGTGTESRWACRDPCCGKGQKIPSSVDMSSQGNVMTVAGAYALLDTPTFQIQVTSVLTNEFIFTWCTNCAEGPFLTSRASFGFATQLAGIGLSVMFQSDAGAWQTLDIHSACRV
jgi:hypothetical protein